VPPAMGVASWHELVFNVSIRPEYKALRLSHERYELLSSSNHALRRLRDVPPSLEQLSQLFIELRERFFAIRDDGNIGDVCAMLVADSGTIETIVLLFLGTFETIVIRSSPDSLRSFWSISWSCLVMRDLAWWTELTDFGSSLATSSAGREEDVLLEGSASRALMGPGFSNSSSVLCSDTT